MSSSSLKSSSLLTPVEKTDNNDDVQFGAIMQDQQTPEMKENYSLQNAGQTIVVLQDMKASFLNGSMTGSEVAQTETQVSHFNGTKQEMSHSDEIKIRQEVSHSDEIKIRQEVSHSDEIKIRQEVSHSDAIKSTETVSNASSEQYFLQSRRSSNFAADEKSNVLHSDNENGNEDAYNNSNDNKNSVEKKNTQKHENHVEIPQGNIGKTAEKKKNKHKESTTKRKVKDRLVKRVIQATNQPSGHSNRISAIWNSRNFGKIKQVNRSKQDATSSRRNNEQFPSLEPWVEGDNRMTVDNRLSELQDKDTKLKFSFDSEISGEKHEENSGNRHFNDNCKTADDDVIGDALGDPLEMCDSDIDRSFYNTTGLENTRFEKVRDESKSREDDSNDKYLVDSLFSETASSDKTNTRNLNSRNEGLIIHNHENANHDPGDSSFKQIRESVTFGIDFEEDDDKSAHSKSISSLAPLYNHIVDSISEYVHQNDSIDDLNERPAEEKNHREYVIKTDFTETSKSLLRKDENQTNGMLRTRKSEDVIVNDITNNGVMESSNDDAHENNSDNSSTLSNNNSGGNNNINNDHVVKGDDEEDKMKLLNVDQINRTTNAKNEQAIIKINSSKLQSDVQSKIAVITKHVNYQNIVEMRAIDRLLTGPYSESVSQKKTFPKESTYVNPTKSSVNKMQIQKNRIKVKFNEEDKDRLKTQSAKISRAHSVGVSNRQMSSAKSDEVRSTARTYTQRYVNSKAIAMKDNKKPIVRAPKPNLEHTNTAPNVSAKESFIFTEEVDQVETVAFPEDKQDVAMATVTSDSSEIQNAEAATDEADVYVDVADITELETIEQDNNESIVDVTSFEMPQPEIVLVNGQVEQEPPELTIVDVVMDSDKESSDIKSVINEKQTITEKPTTFTEWLKNKKKTSKLSSKLVRKQSTKYRTDQKNETDQTPDIKNALIMRINDKQETVELATEKRNKESSQNSPNIQPAAIIIVDETPATETKHNTIMGQVILNGFLNKFKSKKMRQKRSSPAPPPANLTTELSFPESILANGKPQCKPSGKSVSIQSLTVPGLLPNIFSLDSPIDEDAISLKSRRDSARQSFDSGSRKSVDYRIRNTALVVLPAVDEKPKFNVTNDESFIKNAIPFLPKNLAVICLVLNIIIPGSGTALSGLSILCCGQPRLSNKDDQILITFCANFIVGVAQLFTVTFLLVGWFWSIGWGIQMVMLSVQHEKEVREERAKELQSLALSALGSPKRTTLFDT